MTKKPRLEPAAAEGGKDPAGSIRLETEEALEVAAEEVRVGSDSAEAVAGSFFSVPLAVGMSSVGAVLAPRPSGADAGAGLTSPLYLPNNLDLGTAPQVGAIEMNKTEGVVTHGEGGHRILVSLRTCAHLPLPSLLRRPSRCSRPTRRCRVSSTSTSSCSALGGASCAGRRKSDPAPTSEAIVPCKPFCRVD